MIEKIDLLSDQTDTSQLVMRITSPSSRTAKLIKKFLTNRNGPRHRRSAAHDVRDYFVRLGFEARRISLSRGDCCRRANWACNNTAPGCAGRSIHRNARHWVRKPASSPKPGARRGAHRSKHECRGQCSADRSNHINLLIVRWFCKFLSDEPKLVHERRHFQYRLALGMILRTD
jgi:hypothetical protein